MTFQSSVIKLLSEEIFKFLNLSVFKAFQAFHYHSHSLLKSISGISKWQTGPVCSLFRPQNVPFSLLSHQSRRACPHFDLTICPHTMAKAERLEEYYYFGIMRTVSDVSQVAFEWAYFSLAEVSYYRQMFRLACRRYLL